MENKFDWGRADYGRLTERWPKTEAGGPEEPALLCNCKNMDFSDELKINLLEAYGIPCLRIYPGNGSFGKLVLGMSGQGADIYVPASMLADAQALCSGQAEISSDEE